MKPYNLFSAVLSVEELTSCTTLCLKDTSFQFVFYGIFFLFPVNHHPVNVNHSATRNLLSESFKGDCPLRVNLSEVVILSKITLDYEKKKYKIHRTF